MQKNETKKNRLNLQTLALVGIMAALVFVFTGLRVRLSVDGKMAIHLGNVMCLLSGLLFGGVSGGLSAGIGSLLFDLTDPLYIKDAPISFVNKFMMGFVAGALFRRLKIMNVYVRAVISATLGQVTYLVMYLSKCYIADIFFNKLAHETAMLNLLGRLTTSGINAVISVTCAVILYSVVRTILIKTPFREMLVITDKK